MNNVDTLLPKAQSLLALVAQVVPLVVPGSRAAVQVAQATEAAASVLRFGNQLLNQSIPRLNEQFDLLHERMQAIADTGDTSVPLEHFSEVERDITNAADRIRHLVIGTA